MPEIDDVLEEWNTVRDWTVSSDAMRAVPPGVEPPEEQIVHGVNCICTLMPPPLIVVELNYDEMTALFGAAGRAMIQVGSAAEEVGKMIAAAFGVPWKLVRGSHYDEHHPRPLTIDGHAYHRRRRARARRN